MHIPWGKINAELQAFRMTGLGDLFYDIPFSILPRAVPDTEFRIFTGPEAKAFMMLTGQQQAFHACCLKCPDPLIRIEFFRIEDFRPCLPLS